MQSLISLWIFPAFNYNNEARRGTRYDRHGKIEIRQPTVIDDDMLSVLIRAMYKRRPDVNLLQFLLFSSKKSTNCTG